ncbi:hypothetical protein V1511DRAFT_490320 [Dipodascopsis uninucleata]
MATKYQYEDEFSYDQNVDHEISNVIDIPLRDDQEVVTINLDTDLPDDPTELCDLLENELAGRQFWLAIGTAYSRLGKIEEAIEVVNRGLKAQVVVKGSEADKVAFHACLAWLYLKLSRDAPKLPPADPLIAAKTRTKEEYHQLATRELNISASTRVYGSWSVNLLARGVWGILKASSTEALDDAMRVFEDTLRQVGNNNLMAFMGRARILYARGHYKAALKLYQKVLASRHNMRPDPRIGIGLCFWKLGFKDDAKLAWDRALELDPESSAVNVLIGLYYQEKAFSQVTSPDFINLYSSALQYTQKAYKGTNQRLSLAGVTLASYLFSKKQQMETVIKLCERVIEHTDVPAIISDSYFWMARAYHSMQNYDRAMANYQRARAARPDNMLAKVGIGQLQVINNDHTQAKLTFEKIIQEHPKCAEGMLILGYLYAEDYVHQRGAIAVVGTNSTNAIAVSGRDLKVIEDEKRKARILFERYLKLVDARPGISPTEVDVHVTLSELYEDENPTQAIAELEAAIELQKRLGDGPESVQPELMNNMGVLNYHRERFDDARRLFQNALTKLANIGEGTEYYEKENTESMIITVTYNLGRLEEQVGNIEEAKKLYSGIEERMPGYVDAKIRLCYIALLESEDRESEVTPEQAVGKMQQLIETEAGNLEVRALHGWYLRQHQRRRPPPKSINDNIEHKHYKHTLQYFDKHDVYSLTAMGNIYLSAAREMRPTNEQDNERRRRTYEKAVEFFDKSLQLDKNNAYAAQGIAIALAEDKKYAKAVGIFSKIRETINDVSAYVNLGHSLTEMKNYSRAIECYEYALQKFQDGKSIQTMMFLGRVWLQRGIEELSLEGIKAALRYTQLALDLSPANLALKFNLAFCQFQVAEVLRRLPIQARTVGDIEEASKGLQEAIVILNELAGEKHPPYPASEIQQRATMGQNTTRRQLERLLTQQKEHEEKSEAKLEAGRRAREAAAADAAAAVAEAEAQARGLTAVKEEEVEVETVIDENDDADAEEGLAVNVTRAESDNYDEDSSMDGNREDGNEINKTVEEQNGEDQS